MIHELLVLLLMLPTSQPVSEKCRMKCPLNFMHQDEKKPWSYYRPGDHLISMITTGTKILQTTTLPFNMAPYCQFESLPFDKLRILRYIFNIQMMNKTPQLLGNLTLGYNIHDNYLNTLGTSDALLDMLSTGEANVPNYSCGRKDNILALVDAATNDNSIQMSTLGGTYKVPQIDFELFSEVQHDKSQLPFYHQLFPNKKILYPGIVQVLLHFRWTLVGLFASDTENGENFMRIFAPLLVKNGICVVISQQFSTTRLTAPRSDVLSKWRQVNVFLHYIEYGAILDRIIPFHLTLTHLPGPIEGKVWITTLVGLFPLEYNKHLKYVNSIWTIDFEKKKWPIKDTFKSYYFLDPPFGDKSFQCSFPKHIFSTKGRKKCTEKSPLETRKKKNMILDVNFHHFYSAIKTLAHALNAAYSSRFRSRLKNGKASLAAPRLQPWQVWGPDKDPSNLVPLELSQRRKIGTVSTYLCWEDSNKFSPSNR